MKALIVTHYSIEDKECNGDYYDIELFIDGLKIKEYGSYYDDKGCEKIEGFLEGISWATGKKVKIKKQDVSDRDY